MFTRVGAVTIAIVLSASAAYADQYFDKLGIWQHDIENYKHISQSIPPCATVWRENPDPFHPPAAGLEHFVHLYAQCRYVLEHRHASIGVLRVNDLFLSIACIGFGATGGNAGESRECNLKPYLPSPH